MDRINIIILCIAGVFSLFMISNIVGNIVDSIKMHIMSEDSGPSGSISMAQKNMDLELFHYMLDRAFIKTLSEFCSKDHIFMSGSPVSAIYGGKYRDLIFALLNTDIKLEPVLEDDEPEIFFTSFVTSIYFKFISETADSIKKLFYKYYSGYTTDNYFDMKRSKGKKVKPSMLPYVTSYIRNKLWKRKYEIEISDAEMYRDSNEANKTDDYLSALKKYDEDMIRQILLDLYNIDEVNDKNVIEKPKEEIKK